MYSLKKKRKVILKFFICCLKHGSPFLQKANDSRYRIIELLLVGPNSRHLSAIQLGPKSWSSSDEPMSVKTGFIISVVIFWLRNKLKD
jgi:hypothetical protein